MENEMDFTMEINNNYSKFCPDANTNGISTPKKIEKVRRHTSLKLHKCSYPGCDKWFTKKSNVKEHLKTHEPREYAQSNTSETSDTKNASSDRKVSCDICGNSFVNKYILDTHKRRLHLKRSHECNICKKAFAIERELKRHIQLHNDKKPFKCRICNRGYASENYLRYHMITHIPGKGQFNCEICDERFLVESLFKRHVLTKHTDHECTVCSAKFRSENTLKIHMIKHTTAKNIPCDKCDKMYYIEKDLRTHQKKKHPKPQTNAQSEISVQMKTDTAKLTTQILISTSTIQQL